MSATIFTTVITVAVIFIAIASGMFVKDNWNWIVKGHDRDTLRIRCEDERGGVLVGKICLKKEAVIWRAE